MTRKHKKEHPIVRSEHAGRGLPCRKSSSREKVTAEDILAFLIRPEYQPLRAIPLARALGVADDGLRDFTRTLARLQKSGALAFGPDRCYVLGKTAPVKPRLTGRITVKQGGYGFVEITGEEDVFIPPGQLAGAVSGDLVEVVITEKTRGQGKGPAGKVVAVRERASSSITGIFYPVYGKGGYVLADNPGFNDGIDIPLNKIAAAKNGDKVRVEITSWPVGNRPAAGVITDVFGQAGDWQAELAAVISEYALRPRFPDNVLAAAEGYGQEDVDAEKKRRRDFRNLLTVTIDPPDAKDFDDAVSLEKTPSGQRLYVHIADVAHFVRDGDAVDKEARLRSTSVYLPGQTIPMLPPNLTRDICCLREGVDRLAFTVILDYDDAGRRLDFAITPSVIRSAKRLNYGEVRKGLEEQNPSAFPPGIYDLLSKMRDFSQILRRNRTEQGSINLELPEPHILFDDTGRISSIELEQTDFSHQLIEEFMLAANRAVAEYLARWNLPSLYRVHDEPDVLAMRRFAEFLVQYGITLKSPYTRKKLQDIADSVADKPYGHAVQTMMLRSMKRAVYYPVLKPHYALGFSHYLHFTSPIRRYPDLFVHRILHEVAAHTPLPLTIKSAPKRSQKLEALAAQDIRRLAEHCSLRERAAAAAEEDLTRFRQVEYLRGRTDRVWDGVITAVTRDGLVVELDGVWVTGLLPLPRTGRQGFHYDRAEKRLRSRRGAAVFRLGDRIKVVVKRADLVSKEVDVDFADKPAQRRKRRRTGE